MDRFLPFVPNGGLLFHLAKYTSHKDPMGFMTKNSRTPGPMTGPLGRWVWGAHRRFPGTWMTLTGVVWSAKLLQDLGYKKKFWESWVLTTCCLNFFVLRNPWKMVVENIFLDIFFWFSPRNLGEWYNLTSIFQMGWFNHQVHERWAQKPIMLFPTHLFDFGHAFLEGLLKGYKMGPKSLAVNGDYGDPISRVINHGPPITTCLEVLMVNNLVFLGLGAHVLFPWRFSIWLYSIPCYTTILSNASLYCTIQSDENYLKPLIRSVPYQPVQIEWHDGFAKVQEKDGHGFPRFMSTRVSMEVITTCSDCNCNLLVRWLISLLGDITTYLCRGELIHILIHLHQLTSRKPFFLGDMKPTNPGHMISHSLHVWYILPTFTIKINQM